MSLKGKKIINVTLPDITIKNPSSLEHKVAHLDIVNDNLVITIDFETAQFAIWEALQLGGKDCHDALIESKKIMDQESKRAELEKEKLK